MLNPLRNGADNCTVSNDGFLGVMFDMIHADGAKGLLGKARRPNIMALRMDLPY